MAFRLRAIAALAIRGIGFWRLSFHRRIIRRDGSHEQADYLATRGRRAM
jgi:hypothetical protein